MASAFSISRRLSICFCSATQSSSQYSAGFMQVSGSSFILCVLRVIPGKKIATGGTEKCQFDGMMTFILFHKIGQHPDGLDGDADFVAFVQREILRRNDAGAGHQESAVGKTVVAVKEIRQLL